MKVQSRKRRRLLNDVFVELSTPKGKVFSGSAAAVDFSPMDVVMRLESGATSYFGQINSGKLVLRNGSTFQCFDIFRGNASIRECCRLTVLAETITPVSASFENFGAPMCDGDDLVLGSVNAIPSVSSISHSRSGSKRKSSHETLARAKRQKKKRT